MYRHCLVIFLSFYTELNVAAAVSDWNCEKNAAGEWSCVTDVKTKAAKTSTKAPVKPQPAVKKASAVITKPMSEPMIPEATAAPVAQIPQPPRSEPLPVIDNPQPVEAKPQPRVLEPVTVKKTPAKNVKTTKVVANTSSVPDLKTPIPLVLKLPTNKAATDPVPPPAMQTKDAKNLEGWTCAPNSENPTWDCRLVGANPKGQSYVVTENKLRIPLLEPAFNLQQERVFKNLQTEFPFDPWEQQCSALPNQPKRKLVSRRDERETTPLEIDSDYSEVFDKEITGFVGNVEMRRADQKLTADMASYDTVADMMDTQGNVYYSEDGLALFSSSASLKLATDKSVLRDVLFESLTGPYRGSAEIAYRDSKTLSHYKTAAYTSCGPGNQDWVIHTDRLKMNRDSGMGKATNAWVEFKGVPLFYTPYISFPIDDRRATGFLPPSFGHTARSGFQFTTPYYWNMAPNYDMLFKPRYLTKRGPLLDVTFRYLTPMTKGLVGVEFMPYDLVRERSRFSGTVKNTTVLTEHIFTDVDLNYVSDKDYFYELGNALSFTNSRYIQSRADINYNRPGVSFLTRFEGYQTIDNTIAHADRPYQKLPQVLLNLNHSFKSIIPIDTAMNNEFVYFYRSGRTSGQRFNTKPSVTLPMGGAGAFLIPKFSLQYTQYLLDNQPIGSPTNLSRLLPIVSVDTGAFFESDLNFADTALLHTIEPRAYYLYIPRADQANIPIFDTSIYDFTFNSLFRENRFSGTDRIQDANQLSLAVSSKLIDAKSGLEYLRLGVGQQIYFKDRNVFLPGYAPETNRLSTVITELSGNVNEHLSFSTGMQWDPHTSNITRGLASVQFTNAPKQIINLGYRYRQDPIAANEITQSDVSFYWPVYDNWYAMGRWLYSLKHNTTQESFLGLEKDSCCWRFSIIGRRFTNNLSNTLDAKLQTGIFVQLELKGLSTIGDKVDDFLERNISGYLNPHKKD